MRAKLAIAFAFVLVLALPFIVRGLSPSQELAVDALPGGKTAAGAQHAAGGGTKQLIIVTPHVEQIRLEFAAAFDRWHRRRYFEPVSIDWRTPGGTSEIIKQLEGQFDAAAREGRIEPDGRVRTGSVGFDLFFGGGSFEHGKLKQVRKAAVARGGGGGDGGDGGGVLEYRMGQPAGFSNEQMQAWFGENKIGSQNLYDPDQYWIGCALSGFGIIYNRDLLAKRALPEPTTFADLCDPRYYNLLALADPRLSGSITTTFESILNKEGWDRGWRILREMCANTRYFASAGTRPPVDVSQGEAAAGLAIDFYGRGQASTTLPPGESDLSKARVGYVDPAGAVYIDADPISMLNGAPHPELARRFVEFCMSEEGQALWCMPARGTADGADNPMGEGGVPLGPQRHTLRRQPSRRLMYQKYEPYLFEKANPFHLASELPNRNFRSAIAPFMAAFGVDVMPELRAAWFDLNRYRDAVREGRASGTRVAEIESEFYAWPEHVMKDGSRVPLTEANYKVIYADADKFKDTEHAKRTLIRYTEFFREQYRKVSEESRKALRARASLTPSQP